MSAHGNGHARPGNSTFSRDVKICAEYLAGKSRNEVAKDHGLSRATVDNILAAHDVRLTAEQASLRRSAVAKALNAEGKIGPNSAAYAKGFDPVSDAAKGSAELIDAIRYHHPEVIAAAKRDGRLPMPELRRA